MEYHTLAVRIDNGVVRSIDGSPLPEQAFALLVIMPKRIEGEAASEWQRRFEAFFEQARRNQSSESLDQVNEADLILATSTPILPTATFMPPANSLRPRIIGRVEWNTLPVSGASVILKAPGNYYQLPALAETMSDANGRFVLENFPDGEFMLYAVSPGPEYWQWSGRSLAVDAGQTIEVGALELSKIMQLLEPANGAQIAAPTPVLRWAAFPDAVRYHVDVFNDATGVAVMRDDTPDTSVVVAPALASGVRYQWSVSAHNPAGLQIAYYSAWTFAVRP